MKAMVVEIEGKYAIALNQQGEFIRIRNSGKLTVGNEVAVPHSGASSIYLASRIASIAAIFLVVFGIGFGAYCYTTPYSYVDIDINPSIEITANVFDRIIKVEALNKDGLDLLKKSGLNNKSVEEGVRSILERAEKSGYLKNETSSAVLLTISSKDKGRSEQVEEKLSTAAATKLEEFNTPTDLVIQDIPIKEHSEAKKSGIPPGRFKLIQKLINENPEVEVDEYKDKSVKEIIKGFKAEEKNKDNGNNNNNGNKDKDVVANDYPSDITPSPATMVSSPTAAVPSPDEVTSSPTATQQPAKPGNRFGQLKEKFTSRPVNNQKKKVTVWEFVQVSERPDTTSTPRLSSTPLHSITPTNSPGNNKYTGKVKDKEKNTGKDKDKNKTNSNSQANNKNKKN